MSPIYSFLCHSCLYEFDAIKSYDSSRAIDCPRCEEVDAARRIPTAPGGYNMSSGGSSTRPKNAGSRKGVKLNFSKPELPFPKKENS